MAAKPGGLGACGGAGDGIVTDPEVIVAKVKEMVDTATAIAAANDD